MSRRAVYLALAVALAEGAAASWIVLTSDHEPHRFATLALALTAGYSFVVSGLVALRQRPDNRTGVYLVAAGFLWFFGAAGDANSDVVYTAGVILSNLAFIPFAALVLAFPTGRLGRPDRIIVRATTAFVLVGPLLLLLFAKRPPSDRKSVV